MAKENFSQGLGHNALTCGTVLKGDIFAEGDLRVDGKIEGSIQCSGKVVLGAKGEVKGKVVCENAELWGQLTGDIEAANNVSLKQSCVFKGDMLCSSLDIEPGAVFNGACSMAGSDK